MSVYYSLEKFEELVLANFNDVIKAEGFTQHTSNASQYKYYVYFKKKGMFVSVEYSLRNDYIDVNIFRDPEKYGVAPINLKETTSLSALMVYNNYLHTDYLDIMPSSIGIENSLKILSDKFREFAMKIIRGEEWISIEMLRVRNKQKN